MFSIVSMRYRQEEGPRRIILRDCKTSNLAKVRFSSSLLRITAQFSMTLSYISTLSTRMPQGSVPSSSSSWIPELMLSLSLRISWRFLVPRMFLIIITVIIVINITNAMVSPECGLC